MIQRNTAGGGLRFTGYRRGVAVTCVTWFPAAELDQALALWPAMIDWDYTDHADYCQHLEIQLRRLQAEGFDELDLTGTAA